MSSVPLNNFLTNCKAYTCPTVLLAGVQALKHDENLLKVLGRDSDSVVLDCEEPLLLFLLRSYSDSRGMNRSELEGVADQILENLGELSLVGANRWQRFMIDNGPRGVNFGLQIMQDALDQICTIDRFQFAATRIYARHHKQVVDERLHALGAIDRVFNIFVRLCVQFSLVPFRQQLHVTGDHAQGFLQIMGSDIGKLFELGVGALEFF